MTANRPRFKPRRRHPPAHDDREAAESRASVAATVAWTVSVTGVLIADVIVVAVHLFVRNFPAAEGARIFEAITLTAAAAMGAVSLALLAVVWNTRRLKPPRAYTVFAVLVAVAPIVALLGRLMR